LFAQRIIILQPQQEKIDQTYLKYLLLSQPIRKRIFSKGTGATVQGIKARLLKTVEIYFPPLAEQRAIVGRLEALSAETGRLEEIYEAKVESLEELKRSVLQKAFEGEL
jgi:type I restriction enzyme S subunit